MLGVIYNMNEENYIEVKDIYEQGIRNGKSTFQKEAPIWERFDKDHIKECRLIYVIGKKVCGWTALSSIVMTQATWHLDGPVHVRWGITTAREPLAIAGHAAML